MAPLQKFELYVKKSSGKLIPFRNTTVLAPIDKDGDRLWIRVFSGSTAAHHRNLKYGILTQTAYDFGTGSTYTDCGIVSNIKWRQKKLSGRMGPYVEYENGWKMLHVHVRSLVHSNTVIEPGDSLCKLADLATIQASLSGTGIKVTAPHDHVAVWVQGVGQTIDKWLLDGNKTHVSQLRQSEPPVIAPPFPLPPVVPLPPVADPHQPYIDEIARLKLELAKEKEKLGQIKVIVGA